MNAKIGVDGGGTKTELILINSAGATLATHIAPGCNPSSLGPDQARAIVSEAITRLRAQVAEPLTITATHLYMAGAPAFWREVAASLHGCGTVTTGPDSLPVLELATGGRPGLVLHAGTGSFVTARAPDGSVHYAGGLGWRFGDPGSGHDLGRRRGDPRFRRCPLCGGRLRDAYRGGPDDRRDDPPADVQPGHPGAQQDGPAAAGEGEAPY